MFRWYGQNLRLNSFYWVISQSQQEQQHTHIYINRNVLLRSTCTYLTSARALSNVSTADCILRLFLCYNNIREKFVYACDFRMLKTQASCAAHCTYTLSSLRLHDPWIASTSNCWLGAYRNLSKLPRVGGWGRGSMFLSISPLLCVSMCNYLSFIRYQQLGWPEMMTLVTVLDCIS